MELSEAQEIMRGYMAPRSHAINVFVQHGRLLVTYTANPKKALLDAIMCEVREQDYTKEHDNNQTLLLHVADFVEEYF